VSELPEGWAEAQLATLLTDGPTNGYSPGSAPNATGTLTLRLSATTSGRLVLNDDTTKRIGESVPADSRLWLMPNDILVQRANTLDYVGTAALYDGPPCTYVYPDLMMRMRAATAAMDSTYLCRFLNSARARAHLRERATGTAGNMPKINGTTLRELPVLVPPLPEQRRIITKLEDLLARSRWAKEALDAISPLLEKLRQAVLAAAFRGDLTADWRGKNPEVEPAEKLLARIRVERRQKWEVAELAKMQAKGKTPTGDRWKEKYVEPEPVDASALPELPDGWCWASVAELSDRVADGVHQKPNYVREGVPFLTVRNLTAGPGISFDDVSYISQTDHEEFTKSTRPERGDILISKDGTLGVTRLVRTDRVFSIFVSVAVVKPTLRDIGNYLELAFLSPSFQERFKSTGSGLQHIHLVDLRAAALPIAPKAEQSEVVRRCQQLMERAETFQRALDEGRASTATLDRVILAKAFRGELVPQEPNDEPAEAMLARLKAEAEARAAEKPKKRGRA
jgi:type I restriction enzyme S subunit